MRKNCECIPSISELLWKINAAVPQRKDISKFQLKRRIYLSSNECHSSDPRLPQPFAFLRALCITCRDWLWFFKHSHKRLTSWCDIVENVKAGQSARCQTPATNYLATNCAACRFACRLAQVMFDISKSQCCHGISMGSCFKNKQTNKPKALQPNVKHYVSLSYLKTNVSCSVRKKDDKHLAVEILLHRIKSTLWKKKKNSVNYS